MPITQKLAQVADKVTGVLHHKAEQKDTGSSASPAGTMEQAGAGAYAGNEYAAGNTAYGSTDNTAYAGNPASAGANAGGMGAGVTGANTHSDGVVQMAGNTAAPVPTGEKKFTVLEDHAVEKERVERWTEHQPVEREYVTRVEETGNTKMHAGYAEGGVAGERVVGESTAFPTNTTTVHGVAGQTTAQNNAYEANRY